jgi:hypothetical protein
MLNPPLSEEDLAGAMIGHFPPAVQNGMMCANLKTNNDAIAYLGNIQALEITRGEHIRRPNRGYDEQDTYNRPSRGRLQDAGIRENREIPQTRNVRHVQVTRENFIRRHRSPRNGGRDREFNGWGSGRRLESHRFDPGAQEFEPRTENRESMASPSGRSQDARNHDLNE